MPLLYNYIFVSISLSMVMLRLMYVLIIHYVAVLFLFFLFVNDKRWKGRWYIHFFCAEQRWMAVKELIFWQQYYIVFPIIFFVKCTNCVFSNMKQSSAELHIGTWPSYLQNNGFKDILKSHLNSQKLTFYWHYVIFFLISLYALEVR